jgi:hypothetical protein
MPKAWLVGVLAATSVLGADIAGSDLLKAALTDGLRQAAPGSTVDFAGTLPGRRSLADGRASAAVLFQKEGEPDPSAPAGQSLQRYLLANAAVVVAVHKSNRQNQVSFSDLNSLLAKDPKVYYVNWNDLAGGNLSETILTYLYAPHGAFARELIQGVPLGKQPFRQEVNMVMDWAPVGQSLATRSATLAFAPALPAGSEGRLLQVSDGRPGKSTTAYSPDEMNIYNGDYPLRLPLYLYVRSDKQAAHKDALKWLFSEAAADQIRALGLYPAPKAIRERLAQRLDSR